MPDVLRNKSTLPDPYATLSIGNQHKQTATVEKDLSPVWDEKFCFLINNPAIQKLHVQVWDNDDDVVLNRTPEELGEITLPIREIMNDGERHMLKGESFALTKVEGNIFLDFFCVPLRPVCDDESDIFSLHDTWTSIVVEKVSQIPAMHRVRKYIDYFFGET